MVWARRIVFAIILLVAGASGAWAGKGMHFSEQVQLLRELREVAAILFGIMGAWAAIVYPDQLANALRPSQILEIDPKQLDNFTKVKSCLFVSAFVVAAVLAMQFVAPIIDRTPWAAKHAMFLRCASFATACMLAVVELWAVVLTLMPINSADADVRHARETQDALSGPQGKPGVRKRRGDSQT